MDLRGSRDASRLGVVVEQDGPVAETMIFPAPRDLKVLADGGLELTLPNVEEVGFECRSNEIVSFFFRMSLVSHDDIESYFIAFCDQFDLQGTDLEKWRGQAKEYGPQALSAQRKLLDEFVQMNLLLQSEETLGIQDDRRPLFTVHFVPDSKRKEWVQTEKIVELLRRKRSE